MAFSSYTVNLWSSFGNQGKTAFFVVEHATRILNSVVMKDKNKKLKEQANRNLMKTNRDKNKILHVAQNDIKKQQKLDIHVLGSSSAEKDTSLSGQVEPEWAACCCGDEQ